MGTSFVRNIAFVLGLTFISTLIQGQEKIKIVVNGKPVIHTVRQGLDLSRSAGGCVRMANRTIDGTCNNITNNLTCEFGATDIPIEYLYATAYADDLNAPAGPTRPNPRSISNILVDQTTSIPNTRNMSSMVFTWGQFLDHDITNTPAGSTESLNISLPPNEQVFSSSIDFHRSLAFPGTGNSEPRQQMNIITAWVDASMIYGSEPSRAAWLRTFSNGKLKVSAGDLLPFNTTNGEITGTIDPSAPSMAGEDLNPVKVIAGDVRAAEQPGLTSLHTIFLREHNRICDELIAQGMNNDEQIYQRARKLVGAYIQKISFEDFMPALGLDLGGYNGYDPGINPNIKSEFSTAGFRIGHTMVTENLELKDEQGNLLNSLSLFQTFFNNSLLQNEGVEPILLGLSQQTQEAVDPFIVASLRNFLFPIPGSTSGFGLDLATLNLQRGRDHGLIDYLSVRQASSCEPINSFSDINSDPVISSRLAQAYNNDLGAIDLWSGLLSEEKFSSSSFGPTMYTILVKQFRSLRDGDYYYYENDPAFSAATRSQIRNTRLRDIILRNTTIKNIGNVFYTP